MKLPTLIIYATLFIYSNATIAHDLTDQEKIYNFVATKTKNLKVHKQPRDVPKLTFVNDDVPMSFDAKTGKVLLLNFWATWCVPCREEMPALDSLENSLGSQSFSVVTIASGRQSEKNISKYFSENRIINLPKYRDPRGELASELGVYGLPTTLIIDQHFKEIGRVIGAIDWNSPVIKEIIEFIISRH